MTGKLNHIRDCIVVAAILLLQPTLFISVYSFVFYIIFTEVTK